MYLYGYNIATQKSTPHKARRFSVTFSSHTLVLGLLQNLLVYATGREADVDARAELRALMKQQSPAGYRLRDLVKATIRSRAFLEP